ncbi:MAG: hypothetical protein WDW36_003111 [Sanguina aurantia]
MTCAASSTSTTRVSSGEVACVCVGGGGRFEGGSGLSSLGAEWGGRERRRSTGEQERSVLVWLTLYTTSPAGRKR